MNHLLPFKQYFTESVTPDEIISSGANDKKKRGTEDEELDAAAAEANADKGTGTIPSIAKPAAAGGLAPGGTPAVAKWQEKLKSYNKNIKVDGVWGNETKAAYAAYQKAKGAKKASTKGGLVNFIQNKGTKTPVAKAEEGGMANFLKNKGEKRPVSDDVSGRRSK